MYLTRILTLGLALAALVLASTAVAASHTVKQSFAVAGTSCDGAFNDGDHNNIDDGDVGNDKLTGDGGNDVEHGGVGNDTLDGGPGNDKLTGGAGADRIAAGAGNDTVNAKDGKADQVNCGPGSDRVSADRSDVLKGCEVVQH
jgi:Ca2+-binding RTX toxin-like protein